jgi:hypothetical protein
MFDKLRAAGFQVEFQYHAEAILRVDFPQVADELEAVLLASTIPVEEIVKSGGGETKGTQRLRRALHEKGWRKHKFEVRKTIDGVEKEAISHEVDHVLRMENGVLALEIEWNNKDPFFDRDLENYKRLHADGAISLGVLVTRGASLQEEMRELVLRYAKASNVAGIEDLVRIGLNPTPRQIGQYLRKTKIEATFAETWATAFVADKFGAATTHWRKLEDRVRRGVGNPCPLLLIGLPATLVTFAEALEVVEQLIDEGGESA